VEFRIVFQNGATSAVVFVGPQFCPPPQFNEVTDVTVGLAGHVYVSDYGNNVQIFGLGTNPHPTI